MFGLVECDAAFYGAESDKHGDAFERHEVFRACLWMDKRTTGLKSPAFSQDSRGWKLHHDTPNTEQPCGNDGNQSQRCRFRNHGSGQSDIVDNPCARSSS